MIAMSRGTCLISMAVVCLAATANAQEVQWRHDYNAARHEAQEKRRPILVDMGTTDCFWCRKLDAVTFRDATVIALLNQRFIPLKINSDQDPALAQALRIDSYPTLVLASPDGKILGVHSGFMDAAHFRDQLQRTLAKAGPADATPHAPAPATLTASANVVQPGAADQTAARTRRARELLAGAQEDYRTRQFLCCLVRCKGLAAEYADLPEGVAAGQLVAAIKNNPELAREASASLTDWLGELYLGLADAALHQNQPQQAALYLERTVQSCPGTGHAKVAQERLAQLRGGPAGQPDGTARARGQSP